ncbi:acyltransferase [Colwellia sp. 1_MG-2023]|uniref:acyltransferase family protein n=1 Tax=Colwellia sp. 1_MG-2023 TaxID=3062649 RepID=UPI0026E34628|nr:acyltransferase [Colwellia sp. 1_MG-2023]MDO6444977.1 acyltransferase [Colwellia sp. 1_MG-2023]
MRIVALDLVRFIAAMAVVLYHYTAREGFTSFELLAEVTKFGYLGVPLFFMISGYVIALSAKNRTPTEFAISRFVRLYPAFWCGILFTLSIGAIFGSYSPSIEIILANATMLNDYFDIENIDGVYWTLQAELKFYGCLFLLLLTGVFDKHKIWLSIWLALTALFLFTEQPFFLSWFISPDYSPYFIAGVAFYFIHREGGNSFNLSILFGALLLSSIVSFQQTTSFLRAPADQDKFVAVALVWLFFLLFYRLVHGKINLKPRKIYLVMGGMTYPLYLIHGFAGKTIIDYFRYSYSDIFIVCSTIVFMLFASWLIHVFFERKVATPLKLFLMARFTKTKVN